MPGMDLRICHLYPDLLNLYGDRGNLMALVNRARWRGIARTAIHPPARCSGDFFDGN